MTKISLSVLAALAILISSAALGADAKAAKEVRFDGDSAESMQLAKTLLTLLHEAHKNGQRTATLSVESYRILGGDRSIAELRFGDQIIVIDLHENVQGENHAFVHRANPEDSFFPPVGSRSVLKGTQRKENVQRP